MVRVLLLGVSMRWNSGGGTGSGTGSGTIFTSLLMKKSVPSKVISYWILLELSIWCRATSTSFSTLKA